MKNEDKVDESHKSQLNFEYGVHLLNYAIKIKPPKQNWASEVLDF